MKSNIRHSISTLVLATLFSPLAVPCMLHAQTAQSSNTQATTTTTTKKSKRKKKTDASEAASTSASAAAPAAPASPAPAAAAATTKTSAKHHAASTVQAQTPPSPGMVWVNTDSKVYHKSGSRWYGKTKQGKWMTEADAEKAGYKAAKN